MLLAALLAASRGLPLRKRGPGPHGHSRMVEVSDERDWRNGAGWPGALSPQEFTLPTRGREPWRRCNVLAAEGKVDFGACSAVARLPGSNPPLPCPEPISPAAAHP